MKNVQVFYGVFLFFIHLLLSFAPYINSHGFSAGTQIKTTHGTKSIDHLSEAQKVICLDDIAHTNTIAFISTVRREHLDVYIQLTLCNTIVKASPQQKIYLPPFGWCCLCDVLIDQIKHDALYAIVPFDDIRLVNESIDGYAISLRNHHNFYVVIDDYELLVHNVPLIIPLIPLVTISLSGIQFITVAEIFSAVFTIAAGTVCHAIVKGLNEQNRPVISQDKIDEYNCKIDQAQHITLTQDSSHVHQSPTLQPKVDLQINSLQAQKEKDSSGKKSTAVPVEESISGKNPEDPKKNRGRILDKVGNMYELFEKSEFGKKLKEYSKKTKRVKYGAQVYEITKDMPEHGGMQKGDLFYLDKMHKDHLEVFNSTGSCPRTVLNLIGEVVGKKFTQAIRNGRRI